MRLNAARAMVAALLAAAPHGAAVAGDVRQNPFERPLSYEEEVAKQDERTKRIVRNMVPEIESGVMSAVSSSQAALEIHLKRRIDEVEKTASAAPSADVKAPEAPGAPVALGKDGKPALGKDGKPIAANPSGVPEGAKFISCVNGKALYRDKDNSIFQVSGNGTPGADRCAR